MILEIDINNDVNFKSLIENIRKEFTELKFLDIDSISRKISSDAFTVYSYHIRNSGLIRIILSVFFTMITLYLILSIIGFVILFTSLSTLLQILTLISLISLLFYLFVIIAVVELIMDKRFISNKKNICSFILLFISPISLFIPIELLSIVLFSLIVGTYTFKMFPETINKAELFESKS